MTPSRDVSIFAVGLGGLLLGLLAWLGGHSSWAFWIWGGTVLAALVPLSIDVARALLRGKTGVDLIALLAMASALVFGEMLAGAVVAVMLSGGQLLEGYADRRARRELSALLGRAPRSVLREVGGDWIECPLERVAAGDRVLVRGGDVIPVDGLLRSARAVIDESALTGESLPADRRSGEKLRSGTLNAGDPFELEATGSAEESTYAAIVRMVERAQAARAPLVRMADRYAIGFLLVTLTLAAIAALSSGDPTRLVAVLVVATPCPLILAAPIAIISGVSRAASRGVLVKGGGALETLARARTLVLDKTGTATVGNPSVAEVVVQGARSESDLLRLAASVDSVSSHILATAIVEGARVRGLDVELPREVDESFGDGIEGTVGAHRVRLGRATWVTEGAVPPPWAEDLRRRCREQGSSAVFVAVDGELEGAIRLHDPLRPEATETIARLVRLGFEPVVLATGDDREVAERAGRLLGIGEVRAELAPAEKLELVGELTRTSVTVMVGDGINDAPALAAADVGVAMGARGATASSEAADIVIVPDRLDRLVDAVVVARRARRIAGQSIWVGMGLSTVGMLAAAVGWLPPVAGALLQEGIDVAVILNALRVRLAGRARNSEVGRSVGEP